MKKIMVYKVILAVILLLVPASAFSQPIILKNIEINGLTKTRETTVLSITGLSLGQEVNGDTAEDVRQKLLATGIFRNDLSVELMDLENREAAIVMTMEDRWTFIPLPVGFVSTNSWMAGGVIIESNLAGLNQTLVTGHFASQDKVFGFGAWSNPRFRGSPYTLGSSFSYYLGDKEYLGADGEEVLASLRKSDASLSLGISRPYDNGFFWDVDTGFMAASGKDGTGFLAGTDDRTDYFWGSSAGVGWEKLRYSGIFNEGWSGGIKAKFYVGTKDGSLLSVFNGDISRNFLLLDKYLLRFKTGGSWTPTPSPFMPLETGGLEGSRSLSTGDIAADWFVNGAVTAEIPVFQASWGSFTIPFFYETGLLESSAGTGRIFTHGPGLGMRFYVDKVAIPALGADFVWDLENDVFRVSVALGGMGPQ